MPQDISERKFQQDKIVDTLIRAGATMDEIAEARRRFDAMPAGEFQRFRSGEPAKPSPERKFQQDKLIDDLIRRGGTMEQIAAERKRLDALPEAEFQKFRAGSQPQPATVDARQQYYSQPLYRQAGQEIAGGLARVGESAQRAANRVLRPMLEAIPGGAPLAQRGRIAEEATARKMAEREQIADSLRSKVVRGLTQGATASALAAPVAMTGGIPGLMALSGAQADWERDSVGSALQTATAGLPVVAGRAVSPLAQRAVSRLASPLARKAGQIGIEVGAGAAANVGQYSATQGLLGRPISADDLAEQAVTGGVLSGVMAPRLRTRPALRAAQDTQPLAPEPTAEEPVRTTQPMPVIAPARAQEAGQPSLPAAPSRQAPQADVEAIVTRAREAAELTGRPVEGPIWASWEKRIRAASAAEIAAVERARLIEQRLAELGEAAAPMAVEPGVSPTRSGGTVMGSGLGSLQPMFEGRKKPPAPSKQIEQMTASELRAELARTKQSAADARIQVNRTVEKLERTSALDALSALRKAGLLTGLKTHARNIIGTGAFQAAEEVARIPSAIVDVAISSATGRRTITGPSPIGVIRSGVQAATKGIKEAGQILRRGAAPEDLERLQLDREIRSGSRVVDTYVNTVFRTLAAEDRIFRTYAYSRALADRAKAQALSESRAGRIKRGDVSRRAKEIAADPAEALAADALLDAEIATFNNENLLSRSLGAARTELKKTRAGQVANFTIDLVAPFTRTPSNIIARMLEYSPVGYGKSAVQIGRAIAGKAFTDAEQRAFAQTFGRATTGSALIMMGYKLGLAGLATGFADEDPSRRNRDVASGRTPGAILNPETNTWHQVSAFTPVGSLIAIGATFAREANRPVKDESKRTEKIVGAATKVVADQPLLIGARDISEAITRPGKTGERAGRIAGSFVPTIVSDVGELTDSTRREGRGFVGQIQRRVPFARKYLPPALDALDRPLEDRRTSFFDPTLTSSARDKTNALERELVRLDLGLGGLQRKRGENEESYRARRQEFGQNFERFGDRLASSSLYQNAKEEWRREAFDILNRELREQLREGRITPSKLSPGALLSMARRSLDREKRRATGAARVPSNQ